MTDCQCTGPGWCERHKLQKSAHMVHLCQTRQNYLQAWEEGRGPGQLKSTGEPRKDTTPPGPGTRLARLLGCGGLVGKYRLTMNAWGVDVCAEQIDTIIGWLVECHACRGKITSESARRLVLLAIDSARKAQAPRVIL